jgi:hypothetical protein
LSKLFFLTNHRGAEDTEKEEREGKNCLTEPSWVKGDRENVLEMFRHRREKECRDVAVLRLVKVSG